MESSKKSTGHDDTAKKTGRRNDWSPERRAKSESNEQGEQGDRSKSKEAKQNKNSAYYESSSEEEENFLTSDRLITHDGQEFSDEMIIEAISTFTMDSSLDEGSDIMGRLAELIGSGAGLSGGFSKQFIQMSHLQAELGSCLRGIEDQVSEYDSLSPAQPGDAQTKEHQAMGLLTGVVTSTSRTEEVAQRMRLIRRTLHSLNWPNLHHEFSKWVRRSAGYEQSVREFLRQVELSDQLADVESLLDQDMAAITLSGYELKVTKKLRDFSEDMNSVAKDLSKNSKKKKRDPRNMDKVQLNIALARKALDQERIIRKAENRKELMTKLTQNMDMDSKTQQEPESDASEPPSPASPPKTKNAAVPVEHMVNAKTKNAAVPVKHMVNAVKGLTTLGSQPLEPSTESVKQREEDKEAAVTEDDSFDINKLDDQRYGHLKRIYFKHDERLQELTQQFKEQSENLERLQSSLGTTMSRFIEVQTARDGARSGAITKEEAQNSILSKQQRHERQQRTAVVDGTKNAIPALELIGQRKVMLSQERERLVQQLQTLSLEVGPAYEASSLEGDEGGSSSSKNQFPEDNESGEKHLQKGTLSNDLRRADDVGDPETNAVSHGEDEADVDIEELRAMEPDKQVKNCLAILDGLKRRAAKMVGEMNQKANSLTLGQACTFEFQPEVQVRMLVSPLKPEMNFLQETSEQYLQKLPSKSAGWQQLKSTLGTWLDTVKAEAAERQELLDESKELNRADLIEELASNNNMLIHQLTLARDEIIQENLKLQDRRNKRRSSAVHAAGGSAQLPGDMVASVGDSAKVPRDVVAAADGSAAARAVPIGQRQPGIKMDDAPKDDLAVKAGGKLAAGVTAADLDAFGQRRRSENESETKEPVGVERSSGNEMFQQGKQVEENGNLSDQKHPHEGSSSVFGESAHDEEAKRTLEDRLKQAQNIIEVHSDLAATEQEISAMRTAIQKTKAENSAVKGRVGGSNKHLSNLFFPAAELPAPLAQTTKSQTRKSVARGQREMESYPEESGEGTETTKTNLSKTRKNTSGDETMTDKRLSEMIRATERKRNVMIKKRNTKYAALRRALEQANLLQELGIKSGAGPETDAQRSDRFIKELSDARDNSKRLSKMVNFWSTRISHREAMLMSEKDKLALEFGPNWENRLSMAVLGASPAEHGSAPSSDDSSSTTSSESASVAQPMPVNARNKRTSIVDMNAAAGNFFDNRTKYELKPRSSLSGHRRLSVGLTFVAHQRDIAMSQALNSKPNNQTYKQVKLRDILSDRWDDLDKARRPKKLKDLRVKAQRHGRQNGLRGERKTKTIQQAVLEKWQDRTGSRQQDMAEGTHRRDDSSGNLRHDSHTSQNLDTQKEDSQTGNAALSKVRERVLNAFGGRPMQLSLSRNPALPSRRPDMREVLKSTGLSPTFEGEEDNSPSFGSSPASPGVDSPIEPHQRVKDSLQQFVSGFPEDEEVVDTIQKVPKTKGTTAALSAWLKQRSGPDAAIVAGAAKKLLALRKGTTITSPAKQTIDSNSQTKTQVLKLKSSVLDMKDIQDSSKGMRGKIMRNQRPGKLSAARLSAMTGNFDGSENASGAGESSSRSTSRATSRASSRSGHSRSSHASEKKWRREKKKETDFKKAMLDFERRKRRRRKSKQAAVKEGWTHFRGIADFVEIMGDNDDMQELDEEPAEQEQETAEMDDMFQKARAQLRLLKLGDRQASLRTELVDMIDQNKLDRDQHSVSHTIDRKSRQLFRWCGYEAPFAASGGVAVNIPLDDSLWDLENSVGHKNQQLLERVRVAVRKKHGTYRDGWLAMSVPGATGPRMTRGSLLCGLKKLGFTREEADRVFHLGTALEALDLSFAAELREDQFHILLRNSEHMESLADFRDRVHTKFGKNRIDEIFRRRDADKSESLEADEFAALCYSVGGDASSATRFFLMMAEQHEQKPGKHQELKVSQQAFFLSLRQARAIDEVQRLRKVLRRKWKNKAVSDLFQNVPQEYLNAPVNAEQLGHALKSIGLTADRKQAMRLARRRGGGRIVWAQDVLLRILAGYGHYLKALSWDLTAQHVLKHEGRIGVPFGGSVTSGSEDDSPRKDNGRSVSAPPSKQRLSAPPSKEISKPELAVDIRSDQADAPPTSIAQVTQLLLHSKHSSPVKLSPRSSSPKRNLVSEAATESTAKLSLTLGADSVKHQELPPGGSDAAVASPVKTGRLPKLPSPAKADGGPSTLLETMSRPSTTPALPPVKELDRNTPRPATSSMPGSPWWGSAGSPRSPRFAASQTGPAARLSGITQDDTAKERDRQLRAQQWAQVGARIGAVPADSPLLKPSSSKGSSGKSP